LFVFRSRTKKETLENEFAGLKKRASAGSGEKKSG